MNKIIAVIAIVFAFTLGTIFSADIATALKPATEVFVTNTEPIAVTGLVSSNPACPDGNVQHWSNIFVEARVPLEHISEPTIFGIFVLPVPTMGSELITLESTDEKVADRLNELEYFVNDPTPRPVEENDVSTAAGVFVSFEGFSTICAEN